MTKHRGRDTAGRNGGRNGGRAGQGYKRAGQGWFLRLLIWGGSLAIWGAIAVAGLVAWYAYDLPRIDEIASVTRQPSITLMAADGTLLTTFGDVYGETVNVRDLPPYLPRAVMAVEDRRFYDHFGIDLLGLARAMAVNVRAGRVVQGGSTITQQLAKNLFLTPDRTVKRKVQEMLLAFWLEQKFSKDQILSLYLNRVYFGVGTYGIDAAAWHYFGKPATQVNLYEAAQLAALLKAPSRYNPVRDRDLADERTALVLRAMVDADFLPAADAEQALARKTTMRAISGSQSRYFSDWITAQVAGYVGRVDGDLTVVTTLNPYQQRVAEEELAALLDTDGVKRKVGQGGVVILDPDGAVRAMVGGRDYGTSQFNRVTQALRQPGSAFKPFVYLAAMEEGLTPDDRVVDAPVEIEGWTPKNYAERFYGEVTVREAFARSLNAATIRLSQRVGPDKVASAARRLGITSDIEVAPSIALGTSEVTLLELTGAYAVFANHGSGVWPYGIVEIRGPGGEVLFRRSGGGPGRVVQPRVVESMTNLMTAVVAWGSGKGANPKRPAAGKTGTSQDYRDAWFVGYTGELVAGVWLGNDDGSPTSGVTGGSLPAVLWRRVVERALEGASPRPLPGGGEVIADAGSSRDRGGGDDGGGFIARILKSLGQGASSEPAPRDPSTLFKRQDP
jgi:penicillin-binding protein 1A